MAALGPAHIRVASETPAVRTQLQPAVGTTSRAPAESMDGLALRIAAPESMLDAFLVTVVRLAGARAGAVRALCADGDSLRLVASFGLSDELLEREALMPSCGVCGEALRVDGVRVTESASRCGVLGGEDAFGQACHGTVAVPLEYGGRPVGVFTLFFEDVHKLRGDVIHLLRPVGQLFGLALENVQLEQENLQASLLQERQAMAAEIHDALAQSLMFVRMRMPLLRDAVEQSDCARATRYCDDVDQELGNANRRVRELITHFRAGMDAQGLQRALEQTADTFFERTGIALDFDCRISGFALPADQEVQLFHMVQEALANVRRHSGARRARLWVDREGDELVLGVDDDGGGFPEARGAGAAAGRASFGLEIMRQRARSIGARVSFGSAPEGGARVAIRLAWPEPEASEPAEPSEPSEPSEATREASRG